MNTKQSKSDLFDLIGLAILNTAWWVFIAAGVTAWWAVLFPMISIPLAVAVTVGVLMGWPVGVVVVGVSAAGIMLWRRSRPEMFERWVTRRARTRFLAWFRYRRRWVRLAKACHLDITREDWTLVPKLLSVEVGQSTDRLRVRMLEGHCPADFENRVEHLAHAFGAQECRANVTGPGTVELLMRHGDSLAEPIALPPINGDRWRKDAA
ncbi:hypothetical protein [Nocardia sp. CA-119907]|uniref:hypothetical protein n=1 Tax=Nocardia sp. CA-119907 TaxID=3239973 RepID=UPI003D973329